MTAHIRPATRAVLARWLRLPAVLVLAVALRGGLLLAGVVPFNADEAVVGLMARHILQGERPIFFYGQAYMGSLDAWLVAGAFAVLGESVIAIRLVQVLLFLGTLATTYWLGRKIFGSEWIAGASATFLALPPVLLTLYSTVSLGGYGETLLIGNLLLLLALRLTDPPRPQATIDGNGATPGQARSGQWIRLPGWVLLGLLGGLGFWSFPLVGVYLLPVLVLVVVVAGRDWVRLLGRLGLIGLGFTVGAAPWLWYTLSEGSITLAEMSGTAIAGASNSHPLLAAFQHLNYFLLFGLTVIWGMRPPWSAQFLALPLIPYALAIHLAVLVFAGRRLAYVRDAATRGRALLAGVAVTVVVAFVLTPFGADPTGRYFLPILVPVSLFLAEMLHWLRLRRRHRRTPWRKWFAQTLMLALLAFNWWGNVQAATHFPPGLTTQFDAVAQVDQRAMRDLIAFLRAQGETRGYSNYWVQFPLAFLSGEELIYVARLPYHQDFRYTSRDDRYRPYAEMVAESQRVAYITTRHPALVSRLQAELQRLQVEYSQTAIGEFHVFYALSRKVMPAEMGLGVDCCP